MGVPTLVLLERVTLSDSVCAWAQHAALAAQNGQPAPLGLDHAKLQQLARMLQVGTGSNSPARTSPMYKPDNCLQAVLSACVCHLYVEPETALLVSSLLLVAVAS